MPDKYAQAITEFEEYLKSDPEFEDKVTSRDEAVRKPAAEKFESFQITELFRQTPVEALYDITVYFQTTGEKLLSKLYTWTKRRDSDGGLVDVSSFRTGGVEVGRYKLGDSHADLGVSFSRSH